MIENNKAILKKANAAISKGDYEGFLEFCTNDTKWNDKLKKPFKEKTKETLEVDI